MAMPRSIPDKTRAAVIKLYGQGLTNREISDKTGVQASTIYWILHQAGVKPDRMASKSDDPTTIVILETLLDRIADLERKVGRLETEKETLAGALDQALRR